ncbi:MAG: hypothetical protein U1E76_04000 [Planctomycetota bacterium]
MNAVIALLLCLVSIAQPGDARPSPEQVRASIERGLRFLLRTQNAAGSWGSASNATYTDLWSNPETHRAWKIGTTGLCCMALQEQGEAAAASAAALERGLDYLLCNADLKRPSDWDLDNVWGHLYGLQALARALGSARPIADDRRARLRAAAAAHLERLVHYQSADGGFGYYANASAAWQPSWSTSFTTAAVLLALLDARDAQLEVPAAVITAATRAVKRCRLPSGAYTYSVAAIPAPGSLEGIDQIKGSLGRIQLCNLVLHRLGAGITSADLAQGLTLFFAQHRFLDCAHRKPIPHEAYYLNAGYFYFFGHYHAALAIDCLAPEQRPDFARQLQAELLRTEDQDGAQWDYYMHDYVKAYSTACSVLALGHTLAH